MSGGKVFLCLQAGLLALAAFTVPVVAVRNCNSVPIPPCARQGTRDIVFLVDASDSMSPDNFYGQMLDFVQTSYCAFDSSEQNRVAMITFAKTIQTVIPLDRYTAQQWFEKVDEVRADGTACCSCCTPTAEAFREARIMLQNNPPLFDDTIRIVLMISDGQVSQTVLNANRLYVD
jgi:Mg-chelatase subunit ChlD